MAIRSGETSIYGLVDPRDGRVRYVGRADDPELRFKRHCLYLTDSQKSRWIQEVQAVGLQPQLRILEEVPREEGGRYEVEWMQRLLSEGAALTNSFIGGRGKVTIKSSADPFKRFWAKVNKHGPIMPNMTTRCWLWTGQINKNGYGQFGYQDELGNWRKEPAHRWLWKQEHGPIEDALVLDHQCENRPCIRGEHFKKTTRIANTMRGNSPHAVNARKTHCPRGHAYSPENTSIVNGSRICRLCACEVTKRSYRKRMADPTQRDAYNTERREERQAQRLLNPLPPKAPRTTCRRGHLWTPENEDWFQGARHCKQCRMDRAHAAQAVRIKKPHHKSVVTHCPQGHAYDEANTYLGKRGDRVCRACARERAAEKRTARRLAPQQRVYTVAA